jgi:hypothetical protein
VGIENVRERRENLGGQSLKLLPVSQRQLAEDRLPFRRDLDQHLALVELVPEPPQDPGGHHPVDESDDGVMAELELPGEGADRGNGVLRESLDGQEQLVLLGLKPLRARGRLAERQEPPEEVAELRQRPVVGIGGRSRGSGHLRNIYRIAI